MFTTPTRLVTLCYGLGFAALLLGCLNLHPLVTGLALLGWFASSCSALLVGLAALID